MRLIDADALIERLDDFNKWCKDERLQGSLFAVDVVGDMPTVCDIEQIRAEIERLHYHPILDFIKNDEVVEMALDIIDKYIGVEMESEE